MLLRFHPSWLALLAVAAAVPAQAHPLRAAPTLPIGSSYPTTYVYVTRETVIADFNGDSRLDVAMLLNNENALPFPEVAVYLVNADGSFADPRHSSLIGNVSSVMAAATADFDLDGKMDLAVTTFVGGVTVLKGDGNGRFTTFGAFTPSDYQFDGIAVADFNLDGRPDIATARFVAIANPVIWVYLGHASGGFLPPVLTTVAAVNPFLPDDLATSDFNADGKPDLVVTEPSGLRIMIGNGSGGFQTGALHPIAGFRPLGVAVGDLNGDGRPDLASAETNTDTVSVLLANGTGGFAAPRGFAGPSRAERVLIADFDGDGKQDVAASGSGVFVYRGDGAGNLAVMGQYGVDGDLASGDLDLDGKRDLIALPSFLRGDGAGTFEAQRWFEAGRRPVAMATADFDADGKPDLATANEDSHDVTILRGLGDGQFAAPAAFLAGGLPVALAVADIDGDGDMDAITTSQTPPLLSVQRGDGAGHLSLPTSDALPNSLPCDLAVADFNGDGLMDVAVAIDIAVNPSYVSLWFGTGGGALAQGPNVPLPSRPKTIEAGYINADVRPDLVVMDVGITVLLGDGVGGFVQSQVTEEFSELFEPRRVAITPMDDDALPDLAIAGDFGAGSVAVWKGDGFGGFTHETHPGMADWRDGARGLAVADFNQDGLPDAAGVKERLFVAESDDGGRLGRPRDGIPVGGLASDAVTADFNADGRPDVAVALLTGKGVTVLLGQAPRGSVDVAVTITGKPDLAPKGTPVVYEVTVTNAGADLARNVALSVELGYALTFMTSVPGSPTCTYTVDVFDQKYVFCQLGDMAAGGSRVVTINGVAGSGGGVTNRARVTSTGPSDTDLDNNVASVSTRFSDVDIGLSQTDSMDPVTPGADYSYILTIRNNGTTASESFSIQDFFTDGVSFVSSVPPVCVQCDPGNCVLCQLLPLQPGQATTITVNVHAGTFTKAQARLQIYGDWYPGDTNPANNHAVEETTMTLGVSRQLAHGTVMREDLGSGPDVFYMPQTMCTSFEVIADAVAGDAAPLVLERLGVTMSPIQTGVPVGTGTARSLRWEQAGAAPPNLEAVRVRSGSCSTDCDAGDAYRLRAYETTGQVARFNNTGTQTAVLILANPGVAPIQGHAWFWSPGGALVGTRTFALSARQTSVINTASFLPGYSGSITVTHDAGYGGLAGKCVTLEPATGFSFDTPMTFVPR